MEYIENIDAYIKYLIPVITFVVFCIRADVRETNRKLEKIKTAIDELKFNIDRYGKEIDSVNSKLNDLK